MKPDEQQMSCRHKEEPVKDIITLRGRTIIVNASRCVKCGAASVSPEETERARKELNPTIIHRLKEFLGMAGERTEALVFRGKVL